MGTVNEIQSAFQAFTSIEDMSSTTSKREVLSSYADNSVVRTLLYACYSPYLQYNIRKIPVNAASCTGEGISDERYSLFLSTLVRLNKRQVTGNAAIEEVSAMLTSLSPEEYKWYSRVLSKDMKIGMAAKGINKAIKGLVPEYEVLLADKIAPEDLNLDTPRAYRMLPQRIITQHKIDGYRLNIHLSDSGEVTVRTRNGKLVEGYSDLELEVASKLPRGFVYDGEVVAPELYEWIAGNEGSTTTVANRDLFSEVMSHAFSKETNKKGVFNVFDMVPMDEWVSQHTTETYEQRLSRINDELSPKSLENVVVVPSHGVYNKDNPQDIAEIVDQFHSCLNVGWEGLMIKNADSVYEFKRSKNLLKMKLMDCVDLPVTSLFEGEGKYSGMMGGAYVDYKGYQVGVGSGWSDSQRQYYWDNPNELIGKTLEVSYQAETSNKNGGLSLSFPVVKSVRFDK